MRIAGSRVPGTERVVTPLELFFDLVYVFAIGQLSHHLLEHVDFRTGAETLVMGLAVVYAWYMTAWAANWLDPVRRQVQALLVALMVASLLMSAGIGDAVDGRAWLFVTGYLGLQITRATFLIAALRGRALGEHFVNDLVWELAAGVLWVAGAIADDPDARLILWGLAAAFTYAGASALHPLPGRGRRMDVEHTEIAGGHLVEGFRLFFIIALGETVLAIGDSFAGHPFSGKRLLALMISFAGAVALWWCYFERNEGIGIEIAGACSDSWRSRFSRSPPRRSRCSPASRRRPACFSQSLSATPSRWRQPSPTRWARRGRSDLVVVRRSQAVTARSSRRKSRVTQSTTRRPYSSDACSHAKWPASSGWISLLGSRSARYWLSDQGTRSSSRPAMI